MFGLRSQRDFLRFSYVLIFGSGVGGLECAFWSGQARYAIDARGETWNINKHELMRSRVGKRTRTSNWRGR